MSRDSFSIIQPGRSASKTFIEKFSVLWVVLAICNLQSFAQTVTLAWDPNAEPDLAGYRVHIGEASRDYSQVVDVGTNLVYSTPTLQEGHTYYFAVTAYSGVGLESDFSEELNYTVPVTETNNPPVANGISVHLSENSQKSILLEASDVDGDSLSYSIVSGPSHGALSGTAPALTYTPQSDYFGTDSFTFKANDGSADSATATVSIEVLQTFSDPVIAWSNPSGIVYGTALGAGQLNASSDVSGTFEYSPATGAILNAGDDQALTVTFTPDDLENYNSISAQVSIDVARAPLTISGPVLSKAYGQAVPALSAGFSGFVNGDTESSLDAPLEISTDATLASSVGEYPVIVSGAADSNYAIVFLDGMLEVTPATLHIKADDQVRQEGEPNPELTATYTGWVNGDGPEDLDVPVVLSVSATAGSMPGVYPILAGGAADLNYVITHSDGVLTVLPQFQLSVNFQPSGSTELPGYQEDAGQNFGDRGNGFYYGWNGSNMSATMDRDSSRSPDQRFDTLARISDAGAGSVWEVAVPSGSYEVFLVAGDPEADDSNYSLELEGVRALKGKPNHHTRWYSGMLTVDVYDGRLTLRGSNGGSNNKVCFLTIKKVPDTSPSLSVVTSPLPPSLEARGKDAFGLHCVRVAGEPDQIYGLQASNDFMQWTTISVLQVRSGEAVIMDPDSFAEAMRFYRVVNEVPGFGSIGE